MTTVMVGIQPHEVTAHEDNTVYFRREGRGEMHGEFVREKEDNTLIIAVDDDDIPPKSADDERPGSEKSRLRCALRWAIEESEHFIRVGEGVVCLHCDQMAENEAGVEHMRGCPYKNAHELAYKE
jgi:hypothetical protein